jgi:hypothetical protein
MKEKFKVSEHIAWRRVGEEIVALDLNSSVYYSLNETGSRLFELLAEKSTVEEAVERVVEEFDIDAGTAAKDARVLTKDLCKEKILQPA